jgi:predicted MFS family arabinose efflux permease
MIGLIGWVVSIAWYLKIFIAYFVDNVPIRGYKTGYYLFFSYLMLICAYVYIVIFGLNLISLIVTGIIINSCIATADVSTDKHMVVYEQNNNCAGRLQSLQWISLGIAGLISSVGGAFIAKNFNNAINYRLAYGILIIVPTIILVYMLIGFKEERVSRVVSVKVSSMFGILKNKKFMFGLLFILCLNFCPGFGTALLIQMREVIHVDKMFLGYLGAMSTVLGVIGYIIYYKWATKFDIKQMLYFTIVFTALTNLCYLYIPTKEYIILYSVLFGAFSGVAFMTILSFFIHVIPKGSEAFAYALITSVSNFAVYGGGFIGGYIFDKYGYNINVIVSSACTLGCLLIIPYLKLRGEDN